MTLLFQSKKKVPLHEIIPDNFVDIHSHLLPGIDDGVKTVFQSAYILEQLEQLGVQKVITTPHVMQDVWPNSSETILDNFSKTKEVLHTLGIKHIDLEASAEYMLDDLFNTLITGNDIIPLYKEYILVEMSTFNPPININELLFEIKLKNYVPILAHPERYSFYHKDISLYKNLKKSGFLFQLNLLSLSGHYGEKVKEIALKLISENLIDFVGTDIHNYAHLELLKAGFIPKQAKTINKLMEKNKLFL